MSGASAKIAKVMALRSPVLPKTNTGLVSNSQPCAVGRKTRYTYLAVMEWQEDEPVFVGVDKVDLQCPDVEGANAGSLLYGPNLVGGEAFFVPSHQEPADCDGECPTTEHWFLRVSNALRKTDFAAVMHADGHYSE